MISSEIKEKDIVTQVTPTGVSYREIVRNDLRDRSKGARIDLLQGIDITTIYVSKSAKEYYHKKHRTDGIKGVHDTLTELLKEGNYREDQDGSHVIYGEGYRLVLSNDLNAVLSYKCIHRERSLPAKRSGVKSRYHKSPVDPSGLSRRLNDDNIDILVIPRDLALPLSEKFDEDLDETRNIVKDDIADLLDEIDELENIPKLSSKGLSQDLIVTEKYTYLKNGCHRMKFEGYEIILRPDALRVKDIILL